MGIEYLASVFNTILRQTAPILLVALCAGVCSKVKVFNIALEGTLLTSAFFAFLTQYFLRNILLSVLVAMGVAMLLTFIMSFFIVKLNGQPMIVGMAINTFSLGFTTFMLSMIFDTKGTVTITGENAGLPKIALPVIKDIPVLSTMFTNLTAIDYAAFLLAIVMYIIMYKTVIGFRLRAIGINQSAASSLGINVARKPDHRHDALRRDDWPGRLPALARLGDAVHPEHLLRARLRRARGEQPLPGASDRRAALQFAVRLYAGARARAAEHGDQAAAAGVHPLYRDDRRDGGVQRHCPPPREGCEAVIFPDAFPRSLCGRGNFAYGKDRRGATEE